MCSTSVICSFNPPHLDLLPENTKGFPAPIPGQLCWGQNSGPSVASCTFSYSGNPFINPEWSFTAPQSALGLPTPNPPPQPWADTDVSITKVILPIKKVSQWWMTAGFWAAVCSWDHPSPRWKPARSQKDKGHPGGVTCAPPRTAGHSCSLSLWLTWIRTKRQRKNTSRCSAGVAPMPEGHNSTWESKSPKPSPSLPAQLCLFKSISQTQN
jgi:hypothetical protein